MADYGDVVRGYLLMNENRPARRACCFVRVSDSVSCASTTNSPIQLKYESLVDKNASNNLPEDLIMETFFAQLLRIVRLDLPPSPELYRLKSETVLLAHIVTCNATQNEDHQWEYSVMGKTHFIDLNLVQCSVGRVFDRGKWKFIDRSGPTAHIEIASPVTSSQSSITDISMSEGFESDPSSGGSTRMSEGSPRQLSGDDDKDTMSLGSLSEGS